MGAPELEYEAVPDALPSPTQHRQLGWTDLRTSTRPPRSCGQPKLSRLFSPSGYTLPFSWGYIARVRFL